MLEVLDDIAKIVGYKGERDGDKLLRKIKERLSPIIHD